MISKIKYFVNRNRLNIPGWRTNHKFVVIESDDWGSIRMPSKEVYMKLLNAGIRVDKCPYNQYDSLASEKDLMYLFDVLTQFKDINGNHPVLTANCTVANPDFDKIKASGFSEYYYEYFTETLKRYPNHNRSFELWKQGINENVFYPQFHGREHLNVPRWMNALRNNLPETILTFNLGLFGLSTNITSEKRKSYLAALEFDTEQERLEKHVIIRDGLNIFEKIFGYKSLSFVAPNYTWSCDLHKVLYENGVKYFQSFHKQFHPNLSGKCNTDIQRYLGEQNEYRQTFLIRNCFFEPSLNHTVDPVDSCLKEIQIAFFWNKPAIISAHRLNFIGELVPENRNKNLKSLKSILREMQKKWPEVEFLSSDNLGMNINA